MRLSQLGTSFLSHAKRACMVSLMSANGTKQTSVSTLNMSAFGGKADIDQPLPANLDL
jgi:hypothetical protein